jgi:predicted esterase
MRLVYPTAPVVVSLPGQEGQAPRHGRAWWSRPTLSLADSFAYAEFGESCVAVKSALAGSRVDMVLGFSQGAVLATLLLQTGVLPHCRGALLFGASGVQDPELACLPMVCDVPALFVRGERDALCSQEDTHRLAAAYASAQHRSHRWGHVVPSDAASRDAALAFIDERLANVGQQ